MFLFSVSFTLNAQQQEGGGPGMAVQDHMQQTEGQPLEDEPLEFDTELPLPGDTDPDLTRAVAEAERWLALVDSNRLGTAWSETTGFFRENLAESDWSNDIRSLRQPLGALEVRELDDEAYYSELPPIVPEGEYAKITFLSDFAEADDVREVVTLVRTESDSWRVTGYRITE